MDAVIPPKANRTVQRSYDAHLYKERHLIECFFGKIKHYRRIFSRYEKLAINYLSMLSFVGTLIWPRLIRRNGRWVDFLRNVTHRRRRNLPRCSRCVLLTFCDVSRHPHRTVM